MKDKTNVTIKKGIIRISVEKAEISNEKDKISASAPLIVIRESDK